LYRQSAKPIPPLKFQRRQQTDVLKHTFSLHDNKQIFLNDSTLFDSGLGKKKCDSINKSRWNPEFISWFDTIGTNNSLNRSNVSSSIYQKDYCDYPNNSKLLTGRQTQLNQIARPNSMYSVNYSHGEPTAEHSKQIQSETYYRFFNKNQRNKTSLNLNNSNEGKVNVASCMVWNTGPIDRPKTTTLNLFNSNNLDATPSNNIN
jgi:hypothetical protein